MYLPPACAAAPPAPFLQPLLDSIDTVSALYPSMPLLVLGDFNIQHPDWHQPVSLAPPTPSATHLAEWIEASSLTIHNEPGVITRPSSSSHDKNGTIIDLVLSRVPRRRPFIRAVTQRHATRLFSDHLPFTIDLHLPPLKRSKDPRPQDDRPRHAWDIHSNPAMWQDQLPKAAAFNLDPIQPLLLALSQPIPPTSSPAAILDAAYDAFLAAFTQSCQEVVGTKVVTTRSVPWFSYPGVKEAYSALRLAARQHYKRPSLLTAPALLAARKEWKRISAEARAHTATELYQSIAAPAKGKLVWSLFKRTAPSPFTSLAAVVDAKSALPANRPAALTNVATAFIASSRPPKPPDDPTAYATTRQRVQDWGDPAHPATTPAHTSDAWTFTADQVREQCTRQHTNTAPGPDAILPIFLKYAGPAVWSALAALYSFSWKHSITPQSWREANVMALYKGAGDKGDPGSYRPISMTSILIRTLEHLIHGRLVEQLEGPTSVFPYLSNLQFGFRKGCTTTDAIHYLLTSVQQVLRHPSKRPHQCPVLFLDIRKAFDVTPHVYVWDVFLVVRRAERVRESRMGKRERLGLRSGKSLSGQSH